MNPKRFSLQPFPGEETVPGRKVTGTIGRRGDTLSCDFAIRGNLSGLAIPLPEAPPERRGRLWEETCLEIFLGKRGEEGYWEFHLSPAGHWNVYRFASYREGMREEPAFPSLPFHVTTGPRALRISLDLRLEKILPAGVPVAASVCAVLKTVTGRTSHWALSHPGPRPDFHRREGFLLNLPDNVLHGQSR